MMSTIQCLKCPKVVDSTARGSKYALAKRLGWARHYYTRSGTGFVCPDCRTTQLGDPDE